MQPLPVGPTYYTDPAKCPHSLGNHVLFKWSSKATKDVVVRHCVSRVDQRSYSSTKAMAFPPAT